ncbi:MAG TPA: FHA domain-containing protein [Xanthobacteraceae bacterium]|jgi:hypothetical protein
MICRALFGLAAAVLSCTIAAAEPNSIVKEQDGIRVELAVTEVNAAVRWRFVKPPPAPLDEVTATINGRPLGVPTVTPYPAAGQATAVIALLDVTGIDRAEQIDRLKTAMLLLAARKGAHDQVAFAAYGLEAGLLVPASEEPEDFLKLFANVPALDEAANLSGALIASIRTIEKISAERRAIYVFTDGHNDSPIALEEVSELARATGTAVNFVLASSARSADRGAIAQLAGASGGQIVDESNINTFMADPFALMDSGAEVEFPLAGSRRFFWDRLPELTVALRYGKNRLELNSKASVPAASMTETASYAVENHPTGMVAAAGIAIAFAAGGLVAVRRRKTRTAIRVARPPVSIQATLEDVDDGTCYALDRPLVRIGRAADNEIMLQAPTVGRFHAVVQRVAERTYVISDQSSANGTLVNGQEIDTTRLADGDLITLGAKSLRFCTKAPPAPSSAEKTHAA